MLRVPLIAALLAGVAGCAERAADPRGVARDEVLLQVVATGRTDTRPDEARFSAGLETIAATAAAASATNNAKMNRVVEALERLGIKGDDLQTRQITMQRIDYGPNRGRFQATNVVDVRVREIGRAGAAIAATTEAGANVLSGPNLTVSDPEAASRSAYARAYKAARARAEAYAGAAGLKVVRILAIRDGGEAGPVSYVGDATSVESGPVPRRGRQCRLPCAPASVQAKCTSAPTSPCPKVRVQEPSRNHGFRHQPSDPLTDRAAPAR